MPIVVVGPSTAVWPVTSGNSIVNSGLLMATHEREGVFYVSPQAQAWFNVENIGNVIGSDNHPSAEGYQVFADDLIAALNELAAG